MESPLARLYAAPLDEFVSARKALVRELQAAGKDDESQRIAGMRKPSKALWLANQAARSAPKEVRALIEATRRIGEAQRKGRSGDELRAAMRDQREALVTLVAAAQVKGDAGIERRIHDTLQAAAMADPEALSEARLEAELQPSGFEALLAGGIAPAHAREKAARKGRGKDRSDTADAKERERERRAAEKEAAKAESHAQKLEEKAAKAEKTAAEAEADAARAREAASKLEAKAQAARAEASSQRAEADTARAESNRAVTLAKELAKD